MEETFWNSFPLFVPTECDPLAPDTRFTFIAPEEDVWIPSDQTIHWGKRPNSIYPYIELIKKDEVPPIPRGSRLVAKLLHAEWNWDDVDSAKSLEIDPTNTKCMEDDKTIVPFEKGIAVFRHLRVSKGIKLKGLASFTIKTLEVEIGYHNPYSETPFKSLDIIMRKDVKIHIVAHKGSVGFMKKHGLAKVLHSDDCRIVAVNYPSSNILKANKVDKKKKENDYAKDDDLEKKGEEMGNVLVSFHRISNDTLNEGNTPQPFDFQGNILSLKPPSSLLEMKRTTDSESQMIIKRPTETLSDPQNGLKRPSDSTMEQLANMKRGNTETNIDFPMKRVSESNAEQQLHTLKKQRMTQLNEILDELNQIQHRTELLKKRIGDFITIPTVSPTEKTIQITAPPNFSPINFIFYAFRIRDLELGVNLIKAFNFDIVNTRDQKGYTLLHTAAKSNFLEGVQWCLENGANVNAKTNHRSTALHFAYQRNNVAMINVLKQFNADESVVNCYGMKPKDYQNQRKPLPNKNESGCVEVIMPGFNRTFKLSVWFAARIGWLEVVELYVSQLGWDVDVKTSEGTTPLMCACEYNRLSVVQYLLQMGADPNARDIHDKTPLHYAYVNYNSDIIKLLEVNGADTSVNNVWNHPPSWYKERKVPL